MHLNKIRNLFFAAGLMLLLGLILFQKCFPKKPRSVTQRNHHSLLAYHDGGHDITLDDVFITLKTSKQFHDTRMKVILNTWYQQAQAQTYIITDDEDLDLNFTTNGHAVNSGCGNTHDLSDLSCKTGAEYDLYLRSGKKWWCLFDDDNYVNVPRLVELLGKLDWRKDVYLGRRSISKYLEGRFRGKTVYFVFATTGAGVCFSKPLANKMAPWSKSGKFLETSRALGHSDDCTIGFIITNLLKVNLTLTNVFHSHMEDLTKLDFNTLKNHVVFSYRGQNIINITSNLTNTNVFKRHVDPTRLYSLHCLIYPENQFCKVA
uniref:Fringe-like glycosyltransferase domain-containing protein n=1 Tax=Ciona savignyi TaxID=51511 RepID=H2Z355_CIOSA